MGGYYFWLGEVRCVFGVIGFWGSLIINISRSNQSILSSDNYHFIFLFYLHGVNHQGKVASGTTTFGWVLPVV